MNHGATIVSIISVIACLILVTRNAKLRQMPLPKIAKYVALWVAIIVGLVLVIQLSGFRIAS